MILTSADWASTACSKKSAWVHRGGQLGVHEREIKWNQVEIKRNFDLMVHHCCLKVVQRCYPEKQWWWKHEAIVAKIKEKYYVGHWMRQCKENAYMRGNKDFEAKGKCQQLKSVECSVWGRW